MIETFKAELAALLKKYPGISMLKMNVSVQEEICIDNLSPEKVITTPSKVLPLVSAPVETEIPMTPADQVALSMKLKEEMIKKMGIPELQETNHV